MSAIGTRLQNLQDRAADVLAGLSPRDRILAIGLVVFVAVVLLGGGAWSVRSSLESRKNLLSDRRAQLALVKSLAADLRQSSEQESLILEELKKHEGVDLSAFLEQAAGRAGVADRLDAVREKSTSTQGFLEEKVYSVSLSRLTQEETANFLYEIETAGYPLKVQTAKFKASTRAGERVLKLDMDVSAYRALDEGSEEG